MENINSKDFSIDPKDLNRSLRDNSDEAASIIEWISQIQDEHKREQALAELSRKRESFTDLALYLWLQEIINTYQYLAPPVLNLQSSNRACNVLALFQCIAAHPFTRPAFLTAQIPIFLYPFLNTVNKNKPFEYLRLTALGVIGALVKIDNSDVIAFLLSTEIIPLCLRIMERGSELSKTVATFIVQRILLDDSGLNYVCNTAERFYAISSVLSNMVNSNPSTRLVKHIIRSYARLAENTRVRSILRDNLPQILKEKHFYLSLDESSKKWLSILTKSLLSTPSGERTIINGSNNINNNNVSGMNQMGGMGNINNINNINNMNTISNMNNMNTMNNYLINQNDSIGNGFSHNGFEYDGLKSNNYGLSTNPQINMNNPPSKSYFNLNAGPYNFKNGK